VHTAQPMSEPVAWHTDHATIATVVRRMEGWKAPLVLAGDFNATLDHAPMRRLLGTGLRDAARQSNAGWQPTWPGGDNPDHQLPFGLRVMALDHVLFNRQFSAISTSTYSVFDSDHLALVARLAQS
jgi:endonuclease/exonuclease/phosphatase family metal-dependent hydrolase